MPGQLYPCVLVFFIGFRFKWVFYVSLRFSPFCLHRFLLNGLRCDKWINKASDLLYITFYSCCICSIERYIHFFFV